MKKLIFILFFMILNDNVYANEHFYNQRLRKISILLTGQLPESQDYTQLSNLRSDSEKENFISEKINQYLKFDSYRKKMVNRLEELYKLRISDKDNSAFQAEDQEFKETTASSLNSLFDNIISENLNWDNLLTATSYEIPYDQDFQDDEPIPSFNFYRFNHSLTNEDYNDIINYLDSISDQTTYIPLKSNNPDGNLNLAGSITTERFFERYPTTQLNSNRKRAAAIFRVFLCDDMTPVILPSASEDQSLLNLSLNTEVTNSNAQLQTAETRHGQDSQCQSCHHKLDPMAQTFIGSSVYPNAQPSPGELVFYEEMLNGSFEQKRISVSGLNQLGQEIVNQQQYLSCQVTHFWNWFIGENIPLSTEKKYELSQVFDSLDRKPSDFINYLLNSEDFKNPEQLDINNITFSNVKSILKNCDSCHKNEFTAPILSNGYPYSTSPEAQLNMLNKIITATDLKEIKDIDFMPPQNAGWALNNFERNLLKAWVTSGAKDDNGNIYIERNSEIISRINFDSNFIDYANYKFHNTNLRYLSNFDLPNIVSYIYQNRFSNDSCSTIEDKNLQVVFGFRDPSTGTPLLEQPNFLLFDWITNCVRYGLELKNNFEEYLPTSWFTSINEDSPWSSYGSSQKSELIQKNINQLLGSGVLSTEDNDFFLSRILETLDQSNPQDIRQIILQIHTMILTSSEFLIY